MVSSYNHIGTVTPSVNRGIQVQIIRGEWDSNGYNVTDFTDVSLEATPEEPVLTETTTFRGFGVSKGIGY